MTNIFLHRKDARMRDNLGLYNASRTEEKTVPVYIRNEAHRNYGINQKAFMEESLQHLHKKYRQIGSGLIVKEGRTAEKLNEIIEEHNAESIHYNKVTDPRRQINDQRINAKTHSYVDHLLVNPSNLDNSYKTHSQFYRDWKERPKSSAVRQPRQEDVKQLDTENKFETSSPADTPPGGYKGANKRFQEFLENKIKHYKDERDNLEDEGVSRMSMYISNGCIGIREVLERSMLKMNGSSSHEKKNIDKYRNELSWREWFHYLMWKNPETVDTNYKNMSVNWENNRENLKKWKKGETGVPLVDAGMRQLKKEGYMHNRTRQNVASFLTKHLLIDWREGAEHFEQYLADHDTASNYGSWQWSASTGTDSVDIRIFSPTKQGRDYDPNARYIKRYVPELSGLDRNRIHDWVKMSQSKRNRLRQENNMDYPDPIINYNQRFSKAKTVFQKALGKK
jgi:deoxyribodipyrimidine photo-lyase